MESPLPHSPPAPAQLDKPPTAHPFNPPPIQGSQLGLLKRRQATHPVETMRDSSAAGREEEEIREPVDSASRRWYKGWPLSKYRNVQVLLVQWEDEDLGVDDEVAKLNAVFSSTHPKGYNYHTQRYSIPNEEPEDRLTVRLLDFRRGATEEDLLILYYAGHAAGSAQECIWSGKHNYDAPSLDWHNVQGPLLGSPADVFLILDCCFATLAARNYGKGDNWMLGASNKETKATGVARNSFTSTLTRELERCADLYWRKHQTLSAQSLDHAFVVWERDLDFTPKLTRLTDHDCPATDLTPLLYPCQGPKMQSVRTEPPPQPRLQNDTSFLTARVKDSSTRGSQILRILNLPDPTDNLDLIDWFQDRSIERSSIKNIGPKLVSGSSLSTTVTFTDVDVADKAMKTVGREFYPRRGSRHQQTRHRLLIDDKFQGLTCIYSSTKGSHREPTADVVLVHGAYGHPIDSFSIHIAPSLSEASWARESLPKELEEVGIFPRVMTYGWNASAWYDPRCEIERAPGDLARALERTRIKVPERPLIFIADGIGGFLVQHLVIDTINFGFSKRNFRNPIEACFFLALPEPFEYANLTKILPEGHVALQGYSDRKYYKPLSARARDLSNQSGQFSDIQKHWNIKCAYFKEAAKSTTQLNASLQDASLAELSLDYEIQHPGAAKLPELEKSLGLVLNTIRETLIEKPSQQFKARPPNAERTFAKLKGYDTRFLVDDSDSMDGLRWTTTKQVMAHIASIAVKYDKNGVDVRFFNNYAEDEDRLNLDSAEKVMSLFDNLEPEGSTPTADTLDEELNEYVHEYKNNRHIKGLNLIVITDGEPSPGQDVESVVVKYARTLAQLDAPPLQVGIQFVQVGDEKRAKEFLDSLDNDLQEKHDLDRDVSWLGFISGCWDFSNFYLYRWWTPFPGLMEMRIDCTRRFCWGES